MIKNALMLFFICAAVLAFFLPSYLKMQALNEKNHAYERAITELERSTVVSEEEQRRLKEDPEYLEKVAREKLGIIKEDEVIYKVLPPGQKRAPDSAETAGLLKKATDGLVDDLELFPDGTDEVVSPVTKSSAVKKTSATAVKTTAKKKKTTTSSTTTPKKTSAVKK
jgi:cell division protein FtsB